MSTDRTIGTMPRELLEVRIGPDSYDLNPVVKVVHVGLMPEDEDQVLLELKRADAFELVKQILAALEDEW